VTKKSDSFLGAQTDSFHLLPFLYHSDSGFSNPFKEQRSIMAAMPKPTSQGAKATVLLGSQWGDEGKGGYNFFLLESWDAPKQ